MNLEEHLAKAVQNWTFLTEIELSTRRVAHADWSVVVLSYSALHLVDAFLHANGHDHGHTHGTRNESLRGLVSRRRLSDTGFDAYWQLATRAREARYSELSISRAEYEHLVAADFRTLETEVLRRLRSQPFDALPFEPQT